MDDKRVILAAIAGAHGIGGDVRLKLFAQGVESLKRYKSFEADGRTLTLSSIRVGSKYPVARFAEITGRTAAEGLRGTTLTVPRSSLPPLAEGEYYHADIIGLRCVAEDGALVGEVVAVENFGAGDVFEIAKADGRKFMVPMKAVDIGSERIVVDPDFVE